MTSWAPPRRGGPAGPACPPHIPAQGRRLLLPLASRASRRLRRLPPGASPSRPHVGHAPHTHTRKPQAFAGQAEGRPGGSASRSATTGLGCCLKSATRKHPQGNPPKLNLERAHRSVCAVSNVSFKKRAPGAPVSTREAVSYPQNSANIKRSMVGPSEPAVLPIFLDFIFHSFTAPLASPERVQYIVGA